jgi:putative membrane protein
MKLKRIISYVLLLLILLLGLSFAALNADPVEISYYVGKSMTPLSLLLVYTLGLGILLGLFTTLIPLFKLKRENRALKNAIAKAATTPSSTAI